MLSSNPIWKHTKKAPKMVTPSSLPLLSLLTFLELIAGSDPTSADTYTPEPQPPRTPSTPLALTAYSTHKHTQLRVFLFFFFASVLLSQPPPQTGNLSFHSSSSSFSGPLIPSFSLSSSLHSLLLFLSYVPLFQFAFSSSHSSLTCRCAPPCFNGALIA